MRQDSFTRPVRQPMPDRTVKNARPGPRLNAIVALLNLALILLAPRAEAQSSDWTEVVFREPQVRYLLADMTGGGNVNMYRTYATEERDPDSREAIRRWDAGVRVVNMADFQRGWITNALAKDGRAFRVTVRGTSRTILGDEVMLSNDGAFPQAEMRLALLDLTLNGGTSADADRQSRPAVAEALRRWALGDRASNAPLFATAGEGLTRKLSLRGSDQPVDGALVKLISDRPYPEVNVRYFMADVALGGSLEFYRKVAEDAHEMGCLEAVRRIDDGYTITNLEQFERQRLNGKVVITRKGSERRISGAEVKLSSD